MSIGFKKSLFGFNCDDVINYIKKIHNSFAEKENDLKAQIDTLNTNLDKYNRDIEKLQLEKAEIEKKLSEYDAKYDEIERLSENIGKLYLVAQANAQTIISGAQDGTKTASEEINKNLTAIDETHQSLQTIHDGVLSASQNFTSQLEELIDSLDNVKLKITDDLNACSKAKNEFDEVYEMITK